MSSKFIEAGVVIKPNLKEYKNIISTLSGWLTRRGIKVNFIDSEKARFTKKLNLDISKYNWLSKKSFYNQSKLIISLGGDGTLLGVCRDASSKNMIFGVNLGHLGFITEYSKLDFYDSLEEILKGKYETYKKPLFEVNIINHSEVIGKHYFINDMVIGKRDIARLVKLTVETHEDHIADIAGDGIIVSSPTGSTAYSLAAGGPIVHPDVKAMIINPICAHGLNHRPLVISEKTEVCIKQRRDSALTSLTIDGQSNIDLEEHHQVIVKRSGNKSVNIIKNLNRNFYLTLKEKLTHGKR